MKKKLLTFYALLIIVILCSLSGCSCKQKPAWECCTIRVLQPWNGTEFFVFHSDRSASYYNTFDHTMYDLVSYEDFTNGSVQVPLKAEKKLTRKEFSLLCDKIDCIYRDQEFLQMNNPEEKDSYCGTEVTIAIDGRQVEFFLPDYLDTEYENFLAAVYRDFGFFHYAQEG